MQTEILAQCRQVVTSWGLPPDPSATIVPLASAGGFSGALICRVEAEGSSSCLRRWPLGQADPERIAGLHRLLRHTWDTGVAPIPVPSPTKFLKTTLSFHAGYGWQLEPWMPGTADFHSNPNHTRLRMAMQALGRWHRVAREFRPTKSEERWFFSHSRARSPGIRERLETITAWKQSGLNREMGILQQSPKSELSSMLMRIGQQAEVLIPRVGRLLESCLDVEVPIQPALRDVWHDHLLFTGDRLTGLIDPNACRTENVTTDLARLLGSLVENRRSEWDFALACYETVRPLSSAELQLLNAFDESGILLSGITWLDWLLIQKRQFPNWEQVRSRLELVSRRMGQLLEG